MKKFLKDSDVLNRRALLAGAVSLGASTLLAACNQQANHEASVSSTATDTLPAAPSETASATASPSTVRGYSGGSKAPEGEYRKADKHGNAQNVPKPNVPEDGYNEKSPEGIRKTLDAWTQWANYGTQTGDFTMARQFVSPTFESELNAYADIEDLYKSGGWVIGGVDHFLTEGAPGQKMRRRIFGRRTVSGITRPMLSLTAVGAVGKIRTRLRTLLNLS